MRINNLFRTKEQQPPPNGAGPESKYKALLPPKVSKVSSQESLFVKNNADASKIGAAENDGQKYFEWLDQAGYFSV